MICFRRGFFVLPRRFTTSAVSVSSLNCRPMGVLLAMQGPSVLSKNPMRLVTFTVGNLPPQAGVLIDGDRKVLPVEGSVLDLVEGGEEALEAGRKLVKTKAGTLERKDVRLLAPIPRPPQMRDFLCFEQHLIQAFKAIGRTPPQAWYERPLFYHPSRFSVCGPETDVRWPAYSEKI